MRLAALTAFVILASAAIGPTTAKADTVIAQERAPSKISAEINRVVWSGYDPGTHDYYLMSHETLGATTRLPVAPREVPFDVDLGYLGEGEEVAAYSRCRREPNIVGGGSGGLLPDYATGRGCDVYLFDFSAQKESRYAQVSSGRASEFLPSVSPAGRIAFARVYERRHGRRGRLPYLYARRGRSTHRIPGGPRGKTGLPGPTSIDLKGRLLAFGWDFATLGSGIFASEARIATAVGGHELLERETSGLSRRLVITPGLALGGPGPLGGAFWGRVLQPESGGGLHVFLARELRSLRVLKLGPLGEAAAPPNLVSVACGLSCADSLYYETIPDYSLTRDSGGAPLCGGLAAGPPGCTVAQSVPLQFAPR